MPNPSAQQFLPIPIPDIDPLPTHPPPLSNFVPTTRLTSERLDDLLSTIPDDFLSSDEVLLLAYVVIRRQDAFAWDFSEKGIFKREYFPDYEIPTIEHVPWQKPPIRIPKALEQAVRDEIRKQEAGGRFEPTTASYRAALFAVMKKNGTVRLVLDLQPLNSVSIRDSALPPRTDDFAEKFVGFAIYGIADLFSGFDARMLALISRPLTAFHSIEGPKQQCTLPMGFTNSVQEFQRCVQHTLQAEIPHYANNFLDDIGIKGPKSRYNDEPIPENPNIRKFIYEYATTLDRVLLHLISAGITASGLKTTLAALSLKIVGTVVSYDGWHLEHGLVAKIQKWPEPRNVSEVRSFLGTAGCGRKWIKNFSLIAKPLTSLLRATDDCDFIFDEQARSAMQKLKDLVTSSPVLIAIDYDAAKKIDQFPRTSDHGLVVVVVDSSIHGSSWVVYQYVETDKKPSIFGSCTYNDTESRYSQPKAELYGVFRVVKDL